MRILFGIQGTGNGHISRGRTLAKALAKTGTKVDYIFSGRDANHYFDMDVFGNYRIYQGMSFATQNGKIDVKNTIKQIKAFKLIKDVKELDLSPYDRVISDFEPVSAWACRQQHIDCLGISNQSTFYYHQAHDHGLIADTIMKYYAPITKPIGLSWFHFGCALIPPIVDQLEITKEEENGDILLYLPFESLSILTTLFINFPHEHFICYHPDIKTSYCEKNITFKPLSRENFTHDLKTCSGVIANAGFALVSETLILGKKTLVKPVQGQFEQLDNAYCLKQLGLSYVMESFDINTIKNWLHSPKTEPVIFPDVATMLAQWIVDGEKESIDSLSKRLWQQVYFPQKVQARIKALGWDKKMKVATHEY